MKTIFTVGLIAVFALATGCARPEAAPLPTIAPNLSASPASSPGPSPAPQSDDRTETRDGTEVRGPTSSPTPTPAVPPAAGTATLTLQVTRPANGATVSTPYVDVQGTTSPRAVVSVNGELADVTKDGRFSVRVELDEGPNLIQVIASDAAGAVQETELVVIYGR